MSTTPDDGFLWDLFQRVDKDSSGFISADELQLVLSNGTLSPFNPETIRLIVGMFDRKTRGTISFEDFHALWNYVTEWVHCFRTFDRDQSGHIDRHELKNALRSFGFQLTDHIIDLLLRKFDRLGQESILFDDFIQCCVVLQTLTNAFRVHDTDMKGVITINYEQFLTMMFLLDI